MCLSSKESSAGRKCTGNTRTRKMKDQERPPWPPIEQAIPYCASIWSSRGLAHFSLLPIFTFLKFEKTEIQCGFATNIAAQRRAAKPKVKVPTDNGRTVKVPTEPWTFLYGRCVSGGAVPKTHSQRDQLPGSAHSAVKLFF